jgi:hypothetical protein
VKLPQVNLSAAQLRLVKRWGPVAFGVCVLCLVVAFWLPSLAKSKIQSRLAGYGLELRADVGLSFSGAVLRDVEILATAGRPVLRAKRLSADVSWSGEVQSVVLEDGAITLELSVLKEIQKRRAGRAKPAGTEQGTGADGKSTRRFPSLRVERTKLSVRDDKGALAVLDKISGELADEKFKVVAAHASLGSAPSEVVDVTAATLRGELRDGAPKITAVSADSAVLRWNSEGTGAARGATLDRVRAFRAGLRSDGAAVTVKAEPARESRFADDAQIELNKVKVLDVLPDGQVATLLDQLKLSARAEGQRRWRLRGKGAVRSDPGGEGSVEWDVALGLEELKVEGRVRLEEVTLSLFAPVLPPLPFHELDRTRVHADLQIAGTGLSGASVRGELSIRELSFASPGLAETAAGPISFDARGEALWTPAKRELSGLRAEVRTGKTKTNVSGSLSWPSGSYRVDLLTDLSRVACRDAMMAVPAALLGDLASVELSGDIAAKIKVHVDSEALDTTVVDFDISDKCKFGRVPELLELRRFEQPFIHTVFEPDGTVFDMETGPGSAAWTPIDAISPFMTQAVIAHEDGRFLSHHGFAEPEIANALARNLKAKAFKFGASTITMQLVKNLFLHRDKLLSRKVQEAFIVWWLEQHWDKRHILETYLNVIEYGPAIYGIRNASLHYFGTIPMSLTPAQAAFFASILPSPKVFHEQYEKGALSASMKNRMAAFLQHMFSRQRIDEEALKFGLAELETFKFYDPSEPPPATPEIRGSAQPLPFVRPSLGFDPWGSAAPLEESGSFER